MRNLEKEKKMLPYHLLRDLTPQLTGWTVRVTVMRKYKKYERDNSFELRVIVADETVSEFFPT